jgi:hypothetical protein
VSIMYAYDLRLYLSGGTSNTDPNLSIGGAISTTKIVSDVATLALPWSGATIEYVSSKEYGGGMLIREGFSLGTQIRIRWRPPGALAFGPYTTMQDGLNSINGGWNEEGSMVVNYVKASEDLLPSYQTEHIPVDVQPSLSNLFDTISGAEATTGSTRYRCLFIKNESASSTVEKVNLWAEKTYVSGVTVEFAFDPNSPDNPALAPVDDTDSTNVLSGLTFSSAPDKDNSVEWIGTLASGSYVAVWVKRITPVGVDDNVAEDTALITYLASFTS